MLRSLCLAACLYFSFSASTAQADPVTLRPRIEANGTAITLGDVFDGAGEAAGRAIAPAPPPGQISTLSISLLVAVASAAGLEWEPPAGATGVRVIRPGGARATLAPQNAGDVTGAQNAVRRGQSVNLVYQIPGVSVSTSARAMEDGAVGEQIRFVNLTSNRTIVATITGPGSASAQP